MLSLHIKRFVAIILRYLDTSDISLLRTIKLEHFFMCIPGMIKYNLLFWCTHTAPAWLLVLDSDFLHLPACLLLAPRERVWISCISSIIIGIGVEPANLWTLDCVSHRSFYSNPNSILSDATLKTWHWFHRSKYQPDISQYVVCVRMFFFPLRRQKKNNTRCMGGGWRGVNFPTVSCWTLLG